MKTLSWLLLFLFCAVPAHAYEWISFTNTDEVRSAGLLYVNTNSYNNCAGGRSSSYYRLDISFEASEFNQRLAADRDIEDLVNRRYRSFSDDLADAMLADLTEIESRTRMLQARFTLLEDPFMQPINERPCQLAVIDYDGSILVNNNLYQSMSPTEQSRFQFSLLVRKYAEPTDTQRQIRRTTRDLLVNNGEISSGGLATIISMLRLYGITEFKLYDMAVKLDGQDNVRFAQNNYESTLGSIYVFNQVLQLMDKRFLAFNIVPQELRLQGLDITFHNRILVRDNYVCSAEVGENAAEISLLTTTGERVTVASGDIIVISPDRAGLLMAPDGNHVWSAAAAQNYCLEQAE